MTLSYTLHLKLAVPDFLSEPWHGEFAEAMDSIDRALYEGIIVQGTTLWLNSTAYVLGDMVINPDNGSIYVTAVPHTSAASPTTFTQDLAANPTYWTPLSAAQLASQAEAEAGVDNAKYMSALRVRQAIIAQIGSSGTIIAFTSSTTPPVSPHKGDFWYDLTTGILSAYIDDGNTLQWVSVSTGSLAAGLGVEPQGRLSLVTGQSVMTANQTAKNTLYYTPHTGNQITIWNGIGFTSTAFTELSVLTTDTAKSPAAIGASKVNDWFVWSDAGTLRLIHGIDWTNDTTRAAALTKVNGLWVNATAITNGPGIGFGTYVGTTRSDAASLLNWVSSGVGSGGVACLLNVWNAYNRVTVGASVIDSGASYTYAVGTVRQARASAGNQISFVSGLPDEGGMFTYTQRCDTGAVATTNSLYGLGIDTTTGFSSLPILAFAPTAAVTSMTSTAVLTVGGLTGAHFVAALEQSPVGTQTFNGSLPGGTLSGTLRM